MSNIINILCIDDIASEITNSRYEIVDLINKNKNINIEIIHPLDMNEKSNYNKKPDLIIIDYFLEKLAKNGKRFKHKGNAIFGLIREQYPDTPIYLISADMVQRNSFVPNDNFENIISDDWLTNQDKIISEVISHKKIKEKTIDNYSDIHKLLDAPEDSKSFIEKALPNQIRKKICRLSVVGLSSKINLDLKINLLLSRWIAHELLILPGILYDSLHTATLLGIDHDYFLDNLALNAEFNNAVSYKGVFNESFEQLWWKEAVIDYLYSQPEANDHILGTIHESAHKILNIPKAFIAKCNKCEKNGANVIAHMSGYPDKEFPVHYSCSTQNNDSLPIPFFDPQRIILED